MAWFALVLFGAAGFLSFLPLVFKPTDALRKVDGRLVERGWYGSRSRTFRLFVEQPNGDIARLSTNEITKQHAKTVQIGEAVRALSDEGLLVELEREGEMLISYAEYVAHKESHARLHPLFGFAGVAGLGYWLYFSRRPGNVTA